MLVPLYFQKEKKQFIDCFGSLRAAANFNTFQLTVGNRPTIQYKIYKQSHCRYHSNIMKTLTLTLAF